MTNAPTMHGLSYILGQPISEASKEKVRGIVDRKNISPDMAWLSIVQMIVDELQDEDSKASLSSILTLKMERPVKAPKLTLLTYPIATDGVERQHPWICFQMRNVIDEEKRDLIDIDKELADWIAQILQMTFECEFVETVFVQ